MYPGALQDQLPQGDCVLLLCLQCGRRDTTPPHYTTTPSNNLTSGHIPTTAYSIIYGFFLYIPIILPLPSSSIDSLICIFFLVLILVSSSSSFFCLFFLLLSVLSFNFFFLHYYPPPLFLRPSFFHLHIYLLLTTSYSSCFLHFPSFLSFFPSSSHSSLIYNSYQFFLLLPCVLFIYFLIFVIFLSSFLHLNVLLPSFSLHRLLFSTHSSVLTSTSFYYLLASIFFLSFSSISFYALVTTPPCVFFFFLVSLDLIDHPPDSVFSSLLHSFYSSMTLIFILP